MRPINHSKNQRGFSLVEVMVATAILVVVLVGILMLYDRANRVFKSGNEAAEAQQNLRIAYERMVGDIRMAGFDYKRSGPLLPGQTAASWGPGRAYTAGTIVTPTVANGRTYRATSAGTSGNVEPTWPTASNSLVVENGAIPPITWQENGGAVFEQPDEQIEFAGATALTVRGNFDYSVNPTADDHGTEAALESSRFPIVTTGNDEIVTYGLVSNSAPSGTAPNNQSIQFFADISVPRNSYPGGSAESQVTIPGVDLTNNNPPYTLYRFTLDNNGNVVRTPLADNIRSMNFFYFSDPAGQNPLRDTAGTLIPNIGGGGQYSPTVAGSWNNALRQERRTIRAIRVRLVGMNSQPDVNYTDTSLQNGQFASNDTAGFPTFATDTNPLSKNYRRTTVDTLIAPRNLGMTGLPQTFLNPPPQPTITNICIGYCGIAVISWNPNTTNPNASYAVGWDRSATGTFSNAFDAGTSNVYAMDLTQEDLSQPFSFQVRAFNAGGSVFSTNILTASAANATVPSAPPTITASGFGAIPPVTGKIHLSWVAPVINSSGAPSCVPAGSPTLNTYLHEIKGFRIYRGNSINFNANGSAAGQGNCILDENASGPTAPTTDGYGNFGWDDTNVVACGANYYYRIKTVEWCVSNDNYNTSGSLNDSVSPEGPRNTVNAITGSAGTTGAPQVPVNLTAAPLTPPAPTGMTVSVCNPALNLCNPINLQWSKVTLDVNNNPISIDSYDIERTQLLNGVPTGPPTVTTRPGALAIVGSSVDYADNAPMHDPITFLNYTYSYRVRAVQPAPCPNGNYTAPVIFPPPCTFSGSVIVQTGALSGDGLTPASAWVMNGGDTIQVSPPVGTTLVNTVMQIVDPLGNPVLSPPPSGASPALFTWVDLVPGTPYTVTFTMTNNAFPPCTEQLVRYIQQQPTPACSLTPFSVQNSILAPTAINYQLKLDLINTAAEPLTITAIDAFWTPPSNRTWQSIQFPSGATIAGPIAAGGNFTFTTFPRPGTVTVNDVTVPANNTRSILLNFARSSGSPNPTIFPVTAINTLCVHYTAASQGPSFTFFCRIKPNPGPTNPNGCN